MLIFSFQCKMNMLKLFIHARCFKKMSGVSLVTCDARKQEKVNTHTRIFKTMVFALSKKTTRAVARAKFMHYDRFYDFVDFARRWS